MLPSSFGMTHTRLPRNHVHRVPVSTQQPGAASRKEAHHSISERVRGCGRRFAHGSRAFQGFQRLSQAWSVNPFTLLTALLLQLGFLV